MGSITPPANDPRVTHWRLRRLLIWVEAHLDEPLSLGKAAEACSLERTYFCRFFRAQTGTTFSDWSRRFRVER